MRFFEINVRWRRLGYRSRSALSFSETSMVRLLALVLIVGVTAPICSAEDNDARLTLLNTQDHDVVVGVYTPQNGGIEESLIPLPASTSIEKIPIPIVDDDQFAIVYSAQTIDGRILRTKPIRIIGTGRICIVNRENGPYAIIQYRGDERRPEGSWSREIVSPKNERDAELMKKEIAHAKLINRSTTFSPDTR